MNSRASELLDIIYNQLPTSEPREPTQWSDPTVVWFIKHCGGFSNPHFEQGHDAFEIMVSKEAVELFNNHWITIQQMRTIELNDKQHES